MAANPQLCGSPLRPCTLTEAWVRVKMCLDQSPLGRVHFAAYCEELSLGTGNFGVARFSRPKIALSIALLLHL